MQTFDVKLWMINNQFNRRNLPIETRMKLAYGLKEIEAEKEGNLNGWISLPSSLL